MNCFHHNERDAVGICCICQRGVCRECAREVGKSFVCSIICEEEAIINDGLKVDDYAIKRCIDDSNSYFMSLIVMSLLFMSWVMPIIIITKKIQNENILFLILTSSLIFSLGLTSLYNYIKFIILRKKQGGMQ